MANGHGKRGERQRVLEGTATGRRGRVAPSGAVDQHLLSPPDPSEARKKPPPPSHYVLDSFIKRSLMGERGSGLALGGAGCPRLTTKIGDHRRGTKRERKAPVRSFHSVRTRGGGQRSAAPGQQPKWDSEGRRAGGGQGPGASQPSSLSPSSSSSSSAEKPCMTSSSFCRRRDAWSTTWSLGRLRHTWPRPGGGEGGMAGGPSQSWSPFGVGETRDSAHGWRRGGGG